MKKMRFFYSPLIVMFIALTCPRAFGEATSTAQPSTAVEFRKGGIVYKSSCAQCHDAGANGAPRLCDADAWESRHFEWYPVMKEHASRGYLKMPAKGNHPLLSDQEVSNAVYYMTIKIKGSR